MKTRFRSFIGALFSLDDEGVALFLALIVLHHATTGFDQSAISERFIEALTRLFPLSAWVIGGFFGAFLLGGSTLLSLVFRHPLLCRARMAGAAWVFCYYSAFGWAQYLGGATWYLTKIYGLFAGVALFVYLVLYLEKHRDTTADYA